MAAHVVPTLGVSRDSAMVDFVVRGTPRSQRSKHTKELWQEQVQRAVPKLPKLLTGPLRVRIDFFFARATDVDTDNIIKPIQDALKDVVYEDDETVVDVCARSINLQDLPMMVAVPLALLTELAEPPSDFVYIRVGAAQDRLTFS